MFLPGSSPLLLPQTFHCVGTSPIRNYDYRLNLFHLSSRNMANSPDITYVIMPGAFTARWSGTKAIAGLAKSSPCSAIVRGDQVRIKSGFGCAWAVHGCLFLRAQRRRPNQHVFAPPCSILRKVDFCASPQIQNHSSRRESICDFPALQWSRACSVWMVASAREFARLSFAGARKFPLNSR